MQISASDKILQEIKRLKDENALLKQSESIAVIGMACQFPGADTIDQFWDLLENGKSGISDIPENREDLLSYYQQYPHIKIKGGFLKDISQFDASFFRISPLEAESIDPQHRILMQVAYHALENAGLDVKKLTGSQTGVFIGITNGEYFYKNIQQEGEASINSYSAIGGTLSAASCRLSYYLGLEGPSMIIDTACSSSLVALDIACKNLRDNSCSTAIVGGVNLMISPGLFVGLSKLNALSPDGLCKTFDDNADGYVRGEGCGVVILKKLSDALKDGDKILSIIISTAINQDGKSNGFTAPNEKAQEKVIQSALLKAKVNPLDIQYIETHGTGTKLGDPIELNALSEAYNRKNTKTNDQPLYVGSVKTNIGHLESAAGIAGLIKVVLALQHKKIPAHLNFNTPNKFIAWDDIHVSIPQKTIEWNVEDKKRVAAVSSFGFTGTNAHVIIEEGIESTINNKIQIPYYFFQRQSYWFGKAKKNENNFKEHLYEIEWKEQSLLATDFIQSSSDIIKYVGMHLIDKLETEKINKYKNALFELEEVSVDFILEAFTALEFKWIINKTFSTKELAEEFKIKENNFRLLDRLLEILSEKNYLEKENDNWRIVGVPSYGISSQKIANAIRNYPEAIAEIQLLSTCGKNLAAILTGKLDALSVLFPKGDFSLLTNIYQKSPAAQWMNVALKTAIEKILERLPIGRKIRILEIGAGTASTTSYVLPLLPAEQTEYIFTDVSTVFIEKAKNKLKDYPFVEYKLYDVEKDNKIQGFQSGYFDIIIAANVLHATENIQTAIGNVQSLLSKGGVLLLLEGTAKQRWADLIFGLTDGWWKYQDVEVRNNYPLISTHKWKKLLEDENYTSVESYSLSDNLNDPIFHQTFFIAQNNNKVKSEEWLLFVDENIETKKLIQLLSDKNKHVTLVYKGKAYSKLSNNNYSVNPSSINNFQQLFLDLKNIENLSFSKIVYLWDVDSNDGINHLESISSVCLGLLYILQTISKEELAANAKVWIVTKNVHALEGTVQLNGLLQSPLWGMGKTIFLEYPNLWGGMIDLAEISTNNQLALLVEEIENGGIEDHVYLNEKRFVPRIVKSNVTKTKKIHFDKDAWYLISGGLGFLGIESAKWLSAQGVKNIILTTRQDFPKEQDWNLLKEDNKYYKQAINLLELKKKQINLNICKTDLTNVEELKVLLNQFKNIKGIIHAAGKSSYKTIADITKDEFTEILAPKIEGAWNLHQLTTDKELDFFITFSSGSSVWGSKGLAHYAAANHFLDTLAHYRNNLGLAALSLNLGLIQGAGMVQNQHQQALLSNGLEELKTNDIFSTLNYLLETNCNQATLAKMNWINFRKIYELKRKRPLLEDLKSEVKLEQKKDKVKGQLITELEKIVSEKRKDYLISFLQTEIAKVIGLDNVELPNIKKGFFEIGLDSLMAVEIKNRLEGYLNISLPSTLIFDYPTIEDVAGYLIMECIDLDFYQTSKDKSKSDEKTLKDFDNMNEAELAVLLTEEINNNIVYTS